MAKSEVRLIILIIVVSAVALLTFGYFAYKERLRIAAARWHWKNGDSVRVGDYQVPVPRDWLVEPDPPYRAHVVDTRYAPHPDGWPGRNRITIVAFSMAPAQNLDVWMEGTRARLSHLLGSQVEEREWRLGDQRVVCLADHALLHIGRPPTVQDVASVQCTSSSRILSLFYTGQQEDVSVLYSIIPNIKKVQSGSALPKVNQ